MWNRRVDKKTFGVIKKYKNLCYAKSQELSGLEREMQTQNFSMLWSKGKRWVIVLKVWRSQENDVMIPWRWRMSSRISTKRNSRKMFGWSISFLLHVLDLCVIGLYVEYFFLLPLLFMFVTTIFNLCYSLQEGTSNYFKGLMLILCYLIVAASFFVHVDPKSGELLRIYCTDSQ